MFTGILILAVVGLLGVLSHRRSRLENKIYRHVPLSDWLMVFILPIAIYIGWFFVVKNIISRPTIDKFPLEDFDILAITILFMIYSFVGNGIHFTGKILWRYLSHDRYSMAYKINEMFHGKLSHYLVYLNGMFIIFLLSIFEINHPVPTFVTTNYLKLTVIVGIVFGYAGSRSVFYTNEWFGGYNKPLFFITSILLLITLAVERFYSMNYLFYPVNLFVVAMNGSFVSSFVVRQLIIFSKLGSRRRFRFLSKVFST